MKLDEGDLLTAQPSDRQMYKTACTITAHFTVKICENHDPVRLSSDDEIYLKNGTLIQRLDWTETQESTRLNN